MLPCACVDAETDFCSTTGNRCVPRDPSDRASRYVLDPNAVMGQVLCAPSETTRAVCKQPREIRENDKVASRHPAHVLDGDTLHYFVFCRGADGHPVSLTFRDNTEVALRWCGEGCVQPRACSAALKVADPRVGRARFNPYDQSLAMSPLPLAMELVWKRAGARKSKQDPE